MKQIIAGVASLPDREECLKDMIDSIYPQVNKIVVGLNNYKTIPEFLKKDNVESYLLDNKLGDAAKFLKVDDYKNHYYLSCDDDLIYSANYVSRLLRVGKPVVGVHGGFAKRPCTNYNRDRIVYHGLSQKLDMDLEVELIGTGAVLIDLEKVDLSLADFRTPNMADVYLSDVCKKQNIKPIIVKRDVGELYKYNPRMEGKSTIFDFFKYKPTTLQCEIINKWEKF